MTALTLDRTATGVLPWQRRIVNVIRLHVANPWPTLITPWMIFGAVFALNAGIWLAIVTAAGGRDQIEPDAFANNGAISWVYVFLLVAATQAMNLTFAFALGLGFTRRDYYVGTAIYFVGLAAFYAAGMTGLAAIESATNGWGLEGYVFAPLFLGDLPALQVFAFHFFLSLLLLSIGLMSGAAWVRWRSRGLYVLFGVWAFVIVALAIAASMIGWWDEVGRFFTDQSPTAVVAWTAPLSVLAAVSAYGVLRRATPRA